MACISNRKLPYYLEYYKLFTKYLLTYKLQNKKNYIRFDINCNTEIYISALNNIWEISHSPQNKSVSLIFMYFQYFKSLTNKKAKKKPFISLLLYYIS